jgi:O-antigen/teichoic acid export membrane protein
MFGILIFGEDLSVLLFGEKADYIIKMLAFSLPLLVILRFNTVIVRMEEKAKLYSYMQIMQRCLYFFFLVLVMYLLKVSDFKGIVQSYFLSVASTAVVTTIITMKHWFVRFKIDKDLLKKLLFYGLPLIPTAIMVWLQNSMASISLRLWGDFRDIGIYSAALKIANIVTVIQTSFSTFWSPTAFKWFENKEPISKFEKVSFKLNSILSVIFAGVVLFRKPIIGFLSPEYSSASQLVPFLLFAPVMYTLAETTKMGINLVRKTQYYIVILSVTCAVNILGCFILVPQFGALGAAISTALSFVVNFLLSTFLSRKLWRKISVSRHLISIFLMLMMAFLAVVYDNLFIDLFLFVIIIGIYFRDIVWGIQLMLEFLGQILHRKFKNRG